MFLAPASEADVPLVVDLINVAFRGAEGWANTAKYIEGQRIDLQSLRNDLAAKPEAALLVCRDEPLGPVLGCVWMEPLSNGVWYLGLLSVKPDLQDRKLGRALLEAAEDFARAKGAQRMRISVVNIRAELCEWYQRRGYRLTGETRPFPYENERVGRPTRDDLIFLILEKTLAPTRPA